MSHPNIDQQVTFLYTHDLVTTAHFYEKTLSLPLVLDQGECRIYQVSRDGYIGFCQQADVPKTSDIIFTIVTPEVDQWYQYLSKHGVKFEKPPTLNPDYNIYHCFFRDPNGYLIEIQRFLDPSWPSPNGRSDT
jgi:catechol 2,3-dioxygenase-like lactoylglutathione lyase family enzyme